MNLRRSIISMGVFLALAVPAFAARYYTVTDIGDFGFGSVGNSINPQGQVAGFADVAVDATHSFVFSNGQLFEITTLGGTNSNFFAINDLGHPVGVSQITGDTARHAFVHGGEPGLIDLGTLGGTNSAATDINENDFIVGYSDTTDGHTHAFGIYAEGMKDLGTLGGNDSAAYGTNDVNDIVGTSETSTAGVFTAMAWTADNQKINLGTLGGSPSQANSVNNNGQVVGYSYLAGNTVYHAFYYYGGQIHDLGTLGGSNSKALDINNKGEAVGESDVIGGAAVHAFLIADGSFYDLNDLIPASSGWTLVSASSINDSGRITGYGVNPEGKTRAFLLMPATPPATAPTISLAGKNKVTTSKSKLVIKGTATGTVTSVTYTMSGKKGKATGTASWHFTAKLKPGKYVVTVVAHGPGGDSAPTKITVTRK
ncbi:MAG: hypothetical protein ACREKL_00245 [Chthoniobacterales bacterium]